MEFFIFFTFSLLITSLKTEALTQCSHGGPRIHPPFQFQDQQKQLQCGSCSGFELSCEGNSTKLHFPNHAPSLVVKSISYDRKIVELLDPNGCVHGAFLSLNLSLTPFHYYYVVKEYLYLNCTEKIPSDLSEVSCLSEFGSYVYVVKPSSMEVPRFCRVLKKVAIPFEYSPYLEDGSLGLALTWGDDQSKTGCQTGCFLKEKNNQVLSIILAASMVGILMAAIKIYHSKKQNYQKEEADQKVFGNSLGAYEALQNNSV